MSSDAEEILLHYVLADDGDEIRRFLAQRIGEIGLPQIGDALVRGVYANRLAAIKAMVDCGCNADTKNGMGETALLKAADCLNLEMIEFLLSVGADPNLSDSFGQTPLHTAIDAEMELAIYESDKKGRFVEAKTSASLRLLQGWADKSCRDAEGKTPLDWAIERQHHEAVLMLRGK